MTETPRPDPWKDVPLAIRREAHECATSNGRINPEYLAGLYRRGAQARTVVDHNGEVLTQAAVDRLLIDRGEQAETIHQLQARERELENALVRQESLKDKVEAQIAALTQERDEEARAFKRAAKDRDICRQKRVDLEAHCATLTAALEKAIADTRSDALLSKNPIRAELMNVAHRFADALAAAPQGGTPDVEV